MATATSQAGQAWHQALKLRKHLLRQLEKLQADSALGVDVSQFDAIDGLLGKFRLACVHTIFLDFAYSVKENTEEALWALHTSINAEYRRIQGRLKQSSHAVERRKVEKSYHNFLRIAQKFYKGYVQRLSARYDVRELRRVAMGIEVEQMDSDDRISPVPTELAGMVLKSCHATMLRLGDLSRYRTQAKHKNSGYENALTYYSLAHHLKPQAGHAYHQMGMVHLDQGNHLDVVYHFYRSWAVESPHPNAKSNLESEFKSLQLPNSSRSRQNPPATQDAFSMWFVRLHALFYKGEAFPQQGELEGEVMHRLEMACRSEKTTNTLLKMALVNISAHHIASANYSQLQTDTSSQFYEFTLRFNVLFASTFCATFEAELKEAVSEENGNLGAYTTSSKLTPMIQALLPILRLYCMWLATCRQEVCAGAQTFGAIVPALFQNLAKVFTFLCVFTYNQTNLASCPYLLAEDLEIRGFSPLSEKIVPEACRCFCGEDGTPKTYLEDANLQTDGLEQGRSRVLDILRCAYFLAEDENVPLTYQVVDNWLIFEYRTVAISAPETAAVSVPTEFSTAHRQTALPTKVEELVNDTGARGTPSTETHLQQTTCQNSALDSADADRETTLINMLTPFLKPPTPQPYHQPGRSVNELSSSGVRVRTANEVRSSLQSLSGSGPSGKIAPLPWAWDDTPKPEKPAGILTPGSQDAFSAHVSPYQSPGLPFTTENLPEDLFATPGRDQYGVFAHGTTQQSRRDFNSPAMPVADPSIHRSALLQAFSVPAAGISRSSPFTQWAESQQSSRGNNGPVASPWGPRNLDNAPSSIGTSDFSHPSSLYHGTPANEFGLGLSPAAAGAHLRTGVQPASPHSSGASRWLQMDQTTSSYNEAIIQAAYHGNK